MSAIRGTPIRRGSRTGAATPTKMPRLALGQREIGRRFGDAVCRSACQFQPAAITAPFSAAITGTPAILDAVEHAVPHLGMDQTFGWRPAFAQFGEIEAGREMVADAVITTGADRVGTSENNPQRQVMRVSARCACRAVEATTSTGPRVSILSGDMSSAAAFSPMTVLVPVPNSYVYNFLRRVNWMSAQAFPSSWRKPATHSHRI